MQGDRIVAVKTDQGDIACGKVVNCAGQWARQVGAFAGVNVPLQPVKHQYIVTERIDGLASDAPTVRDPDRRTYFKEEVGGLVMGLQAEPTGLGHRPCRRRRAGRPGVPPLQRRFRSFRAAYEPGDRSRAGAGATAGRSAISRPAATATRWARISATAMSVTPRASATISCGRARTNWSPQPSARRLASNWPRSTTRRWRASRRSLS